MSRYDALCTLYSDSRQRFSDYHADCIHFAEALVEGLATFFSVPQDRFRVIPTLQKAEPGKTYPVSEALLLGQDMYWHIGIEMTLIPVNGAGFPAQPVLIVLGIKKEGDAFLIKTSEKEKGFSIPDAERSDLSAFYEELYQLVQTWLNATLNRFVETKPVVCKIGFMSECE